MLEKGGGVGGRGGGGLPDPAVSSVVRATPDHGGKGACNTIVPAPTEAEIEG